MLSVNDASILTYMTAFTVLFYTEIRFLILHLIFDRFLEIYTNIKYPVYMPLRKVALLVVTHWSISAVCGIINFALVTVDKFDDSLLFTF